MTPRNSKEPRTMHYKDRSLVHIQQLQITHSTCITLRRLTHYKYIPQRLRGSAILIHGPFMFSLTDSLPPVAIILILFAKGYMYSVILHPCLQIYTRCKNQNSIPFHYDFNPDQANTHHNHGCTYD